MVDFVDFYFFLDGLLGELLMLLDCVLFLLELLFEQLDSVTHGLGLFSLFLQLVLFVDQ